MGFVIYGIVAVGTRFLGGLVLSQQTSVLNVLFAVWCGVILVVVAAWLVWELWNAVAPKPMADEFLQLLDSSFGADWRAPRRWPWARLRWAYGFTTVGVFLGFWLDHLHGQ